MEKSTWAKSSTGPDETDVISMMAALAALHSGRVELTMRLGGTGFVPTSETDIMMHFDVLPGSSIPATVKVTAKWPCNTHRTLWACLYAGLHQLDHEISFVYEQQGFWT